MSQSISKIRNRWRGLGWRWQAASILCLTALLAWLTCLPTPLFNSPYSTLVEDHDGRLLSARIAADEQWRFPPSDSLDERYVRCVQLFEDEYFRWHPGVNPVSIGRALRQNLGAGRTVSGGSTLTMQTVRLMRGDERRSVWEKLIEVAWATRLELTYSKEEILALYAAHAPFGGNVVGLDAAAWRYYGRGPTHFSWGEAAALAVLPNAPGVIYPGRSDAAFRQKRDGLLDKLHARGDIDEETLELAKLEPLPGEPMRLPDLAPQLTLPNAPFAPNGVHQSTAHPPTNSSTDPPIHLSRFGWRCGWPRSRFGSFGLSGSGGRNSCGDGGDSDARTSEHEGERDGGCGAVGLDAVECCDRWWRHDRGDEEQEGEEHGESSVTKQWSMQQSPEAHTEKPSRAGHDCADHEVAGPVAAGARHDREPGHDDADCNDRHCDRGSACGVEPRRRPAGCGEQVTVCVGVEVAC